MSTWIGDLRYAARVLWRQRTATLMAFLTLALAIGATTGIFTVVDATLLRALPYPEPDGLVQVARSVPRTMTTTSTPKFLAWHAQGGELFTGMAAYDSLDSGFNLVGAGRPDRLSGARVSADFLTVMGVQPALGRGFRADEDLPGHAKVVVLSHDVWQQRFDGRTDLVGQAISLNAEPYTVIGIMPAGFRFPEKAVLWTLLQLDPASHARENLYEVVGRLRSGVSIAQARAGMAIVADGFRRAHPEMSDNDRESIAINPLRDRLYGDMRPALLVLLAAVGFVLLIACVNVANLQLAQAAERRHELALRAALGASTWDVVRQLLAESMLLAAISGIAGICLAYWLVPVLLAITPIEMVGVSSIRVDTRVLAFAMAISLCSGITFGLLPAWQGARPDLDQVLRAGGRRTISGGRGGWVRRVLIAGEVALALMLTIGSFLLVKSLVGLQSRAPGFSVENVVTMKMSLPETRYGTGETLSQFQERVEERIASVPGVRAAALATSLPMQQGFDMPFTIEGKYKPGSKEGIGDAFYRAVGPSYFTALQIPLKSGRLFDARDRRGALPVAIINESTARHLWPGENPIGKHIHVGRPFVPNLADPAPREIVGVVGNVAELGVRNGTPPILYVPLSQQSAGMTHLAISMLPIALVVRGEGSIASLTQATQEAVWSVDSTQPVFEVRLLREIVTRSLGSQMFNTLLLASLAALALLLAAVGLYGVISHLVGQQTREIGIRMALGATQTGVLGLFVRQALLLVAIGIVIGLGGAFGLTRFLRSLLTDISTTDPWVFLLAPATLLAIGLIATLKPALRAARIDPSTALRSD
jgi:putative ABC transport system permease protein